jgi:hypothetical protein
VYIIGCLGQRIKTKLMDVEFRVLVWFGVRSVSSLSSVSEFVTQFDINVIYVS